MAAFNQFNHQTGSHVEVDGASLYYEEQGQPDGPPLLCLHGGFGNIDTFNAMAPDLGRTFRLIGIDSRGQGASTLGPAPLSYRRLQQDVEAIARHLGLKRLSILGHSDGGIVALRLAACGVLDIGRLAVMGAHWTLAPADPARDAYANVTAQGWREMFPQSYESYRILNPQPDFGRLATQLVNMWLDESEDGYPGEQVREITSDLLVLRGDEDELVSRAHALELAGRVRGARLANIPFAGHSVQEDRPEWILPMLKTFWAP